MKKNLYLFFLLSSLNIISQEIEFNWVNQIEGNYNEIVESQIDENNNLYVSGFFSGDAFGGNINFNGTANTSISFLEMDGIFIAKYSSLGELIWAIPIYESGFASIDSRLSLRIDDNGALYLGGNYSGSITLDPNSQNIVLSSTDSSDDSFIAKFDTDGNFLWVKELKGTNNVNLVSLHLSENGSTVFATGHFNQNIFLDENEDSSQFISNGFEDVFIGSYTASGDYLWGKSFGSNSSDNAAALLVDSNNDLIALGSFTGTIDVGDDTNPFTLTSQAFRDNYIIKFNTNGDPIWSKQIEDSVVINGAVTDTDGTILMVGSFSDNQDFDPSSNVFEIQSNNNQNDAFLLSLSTEGIFNWVSVFGGNSTDLGTALTLDEDNNIIIGGWYEGSFDYTIGDAIVNVSTNGVFDCFILTFNPSGSPTDLVTFGGPETDFLNAIETGTNTLHAFGLFNDTVDSNPTDEVSNVTNPNSNSNSYVLSLSNTNSLSVLENSFIKETIKIFPNPTNQYVNIKELNPNTNQSIRAILKNTVGQIIQDELVNELKTIELIGDSGMYFLELYDQESLLEIIKIIKK